MSMVGAQLLHYPVSAVSLWKGTVSPYGKRPNYRLCPSFGASQFPPRGGLISLTTRAGPDNRLSLGGDFGLCCQGGIRADGRRIGLRFGSRLRVSKPASRRWFHMASVERSSSQSVRSNNSSTTNSSAADHVGDSSNEGNFETGTVSQQFSSSVTLPAMIPRSLRITQLSIIEKAFLLLGFIASMTSFALFALIVTAIPTLNAMRKAAVSMEKLAEVAREELPGTMAAVRLSGMEISDLTLELNDLSQEISDGMKSSARAVRAAEVGLRRMGEVAASQTLAMLQERASVPVEVVKPAVVSAAATTLQAVAQAQQIVLGLVSHPRSWLGRRGNQEGKEKPINVERTNESSAASRVQTEERPLDLASESSLLPDEREIALYASADEYLRPDESEFLLFDEVDSDDDENEPGRSRQGELKE